MKDKKIVNNFISNLSHYDDIDSKDLMVYIVSLLFYFYFNDYAYEKQKFGITYDNKKEPLKANFKFTDLEDFLKNVKYENSDAKKFYKDIFDYLEKKYLDEDKINELIRVIYRYNNYPLVYECLIKEYSSYKRNEVGQYITPNSINELIKELAINLGNFQEVYNPTIGSGLLVSGIVKDGRIKNVYGQDISEEAAVLSKVNLLINGLGYQNINIKVDDVIDKPHFTDKQFDLIVSQPPVGLRWTAHEFFKDDKRFKDFFALAPKRAADYAFIQHMIYYLSERGTMIIAMTHGMLFRGGTEGIIREELIKNNLLDAVIGLPKQLNYSTRIPTVILIFKKNRTSDKVFFINAEGEFIYDRPVNKLSDKTINKIARTYKTKEVINKYSNYVSLNEIKKNDYNLNISRYVNTFEAEKLMELDVINDKLRNIEDELKLIEKQIKGNSITNRLF